jgi:hypothetical protein
LGARSDEVETSSGTHRRSQKGTIRLAVSVAAVLIYAAYGLDTVPTTTEALPSGVSTPALPVSIIFQVELLTGQTTLVTGGVYNMSIQDTYSGGQGFSYVVRVALVNG